MSDKKEKKNSKYHRAKHLNIFLALFILFLIFGKELILYTFAMGYPGLVIRTGLYLTFFGTLFFIVAVSWKPKQDGVPRLILALVFVFILGSAFTPRLEFKNTVADLFARPLTERTWADLEYKGGSKGQIRKHCYLLKLKSDANPFYYETLNVSKLETWYDRKGNPVFVPPPAGYEKNISLKIMVEVTYYPNSGTRVSNKILDVAD